ncbi:3-mercaptopyruvate sulfurtransferase-like isoform X1 [Mytilus trossulus]|uniref:3-mercaptopyruvate sulfurtransferase-like isoform X1 n=1 Tax=Mytilus trossulus TaxID=6551 RepID=UPI003006915F
MLTKASALVTTEWLHNVMKSGDPKDIRILDSSFHLPSSNRNGRKEYEEKHIPGALYFDIKECCDKSSPYGLMLPDTKRFEQYVGNLGIDNSTHIVVYDNGVNYGFFSAPRIWWMFRVFGHEMVSVLDGGFMKWCSEGLPTTSEVVQVPKTIFDGIYHPHLVKSYEDIVKNLKDNSFQLMDARGGGQFMGIKPEAREGLESGHIPYSKNLCYQDIVDKENGVMLDVKELKKLFNETGIDLSKPLVSSCASGLTACCIAFAAYLCGKEDVPVYDGSWPEWYLRSTPDMRFCPSDKKEATCMIC